MRLKEATEGSGPPPDNLDVYLDLTAEDIAQIVLCLLIEEALRGRLATFRPETRRGERNGSLRLRA